ncbi:lasso peptide biosynthesis PqqD family chaperone [Paenibacillus thiaminolyticus]|uniref:Lasso peptide biosynthesis PqqD family chaperone n=1 Tax=Paenibacillus thiaminolyticus TaxID=49283 RepID=A0AAP9DX23_PANTH|nr:lasso peptide biosynthesis PqqD family chaperone [Paenibacillus thiaminolyticus]MCY9534288.1 lasso peptide biosynthesis PqqD family chaperone [Paenibacillus thiaminolyticus]MCY9602999.1 lasso peptide biosynthesis PqqD family chaperone [Paenibacillus thiaminolyticus]MCY9608230.1 lasso peptide biosynthesis PqqD family chaperone [Paenibacillus thiaminolyticus]MCY9611598.1 lasso peptide biosynthesis PqqD family chaperone [Paenibacillus thiaminolyticus]MCY9618274.1 lasso peptide biosynthesis Pqq
MSKLHSITPVDTLVQCEGHIVSDMAGEKVMLSVQKGKYYNLGTLGGEIWDMLITPVKAEHIIRSILSAYEVESSECEEDILLFLSDLEHEGLIRHVKRL